MKLKFLFFPIALAISIIISIWLIWPGIFSREIGSEGVLKLEENLAEKEMALKSVEGKLSNVEKLEESLKSKTSEEALIKEYVPIVKSEEDIINHMNYLTNSAGLSLISLSVEEETNKSSGTRNAGASSVSRNLEGKIAISDTVSGIAAGAGDALAAANPVEGLGLETSEALNNAEVSLMKTEASLSGEYDRIMDFLFQAQKTDLLNNVYSLNITKENETTNEEGETQPSNNLLVSMVIYFAYLPEPNVRTLGDLSDPIFLQKEGFKFSAVDKLRESIYKEAPDITIGNTRDRNPFIP